MDIQTVSKLRLLFVCLGNICRSPAADGIMHLKAAERGWDEALTIDSAGIGGWHVGQAMILFTERANLIRRQTLTALTISS